MFTDFLIADLSVRLRLEGTLYVDKNFEPFLEQCQAADIEVDIAQTPQLVWPPMRELYWDGMCAVFGNGSDHQRRYADDKTGEHPYAAVDYDWETGLVTVRHLPGYADAFAEVRNCFARIGFEEILISRSRLILHASLIDTAFGGILFSGPSGIGKSTQAELWQKYEGAALINGDRPILRKKDGGWYAYGSPYAGSSRCYVNRGVPVAAVILLEQGGECAIRRVSVAEAFRKLYAGMVVNSWNPRFVEHLCDLTQELAQAVPVYHLTCTPEKAAVDIVKRCLSEGRD